MQTDAAWTTGIDAWKQFVHKHPELGYRAGKWAFHNFLRYYRSSLVATDAIRLAKRRFWVANPSRFNAVAFDCATGRIPVGGEQ